MTRDETQTLQLAAAIIKRELVARGVVKIRGFGRFKATTLPTSVDHPMDDNAEFCLDHVAVTVRFRPFLDLRRVLGGVVKLCYAKLPWTTHPACRTYWGPRCHRRHGHDGECTVTRLTHPWEQ